MSRKHERHRAAAGRPAAVALADRQPARIEPADEVSRTIDSALELGWAALRADRAAEALEVCEAVLQLRPQQPQALYILVNLMHRAELRQQAREVLEQAIAAHPDPPPTWRGHLGLLLIELGHAEEAADVCHAALARHRDDPDLLCVLGLAYKAMGQPKPAVAALQRAVSRPGCQPRVYGELARALMAVGRSGDAVTAYATALHRGGQPMRGRHIGAYTTSTVRDWCERRKAPYRVVIGAGQGRTFLPRYEEFPGLCEPVPLPQPEVYLAEIPDASVIGELGVVLTADGSALLDLAFGPRSERHDLAQTLIPYVDSRTALVDAIAVAGEPIESGILLQGPGGSNYYHWVVEHLSRILVLELADVPADVPLLVDAEVMRVPQLVEALRAVDTTGRRVLQLDPGVEYRVRRLLIPGPLFWAAPNLRDHLQLEVGDNLVAAEAVAFLRSRLASPAGPATGRRHLYVARRARTAGARLVNEDAVRRVFVDLSFEIVAPDTMTFDEQRALFADAAVVASETGAALTNMLLAPASATLICLQAEAWPMNVYADLVGHADQPSIFLTGAVESERPPKPYQVKFSIDTNRLREIVGRLLETTGSAANADHPQENAT
jgi:capsular polysaccharide biosynthesis protein/Flp pilus assembly protein TadD